MAHHGAPSATLTPELVLKAYCLGIFPMAKHANEDEIYWVQPEHRGVIPLDTVHVPRRLARLMRTGEYEIRINSHFNATIEACAAPNPMRPDTWLNEPLKAVYKELHTMGYAHSVECWHEENMVGGLYGVAFGRAFFGESMFHTMRDASKIALVALIQHLQHHDFMLLDTQFITDHLKQFGAIEIERIEFNGLLQIALDGEAEF